MSQCVTQHTFFVQTASFASVHCNESLIWFMSSGFCYTINTRSSPGLLSDILLLTYVMKILQLWICRTSAFTCSSSSWMGCILGLSAHLLAHAHTIRASSRALPRRGAGPALLLLHPQDNSMPRPNLRYQGQLYCAAQARCRTYSPECCSCINNFSTRGGSS